MILGIRPPTFWVSLALVIVILAVAIRGNVGGVWQLRMRRGELELRSFNLLRR